ncbi:hypothetical protein QUB13_27090 [Microcoleus sp. B4-D4]
MGNRESGIGNRASDIGHTTLENRYITSRPKKPGFLLNLVAAIKDVAKNPVSDESRFPAIK